MNAAPLASCAGNLPFSPSLLPRPREAELIEDALPHTLSWWTVDAGVVAVAHSGVVRFADQGEGYTQVEVSLRYELPGGLLGETVVRLFDDLQRKLEQACHELQTLIEQR